MKELSIEEKAKANDGNYKAYTELISRLEDVKDAIKKQNYGIAMDMLCKPYPAFQIITLSSELRESEDERIRKWLVNYFREVCDNVAEKEKNAVLAWLEKQGRLMKALQISNSRIAELVEEKYNLEEKLKKQSEQKPNFCHHEVDLSNCSEDYTKGYYDGWNNCNQQHAQLEAEQNPAWSEEDEIALGDALWCCKQAASIAKDENDMGNAWYAENWLKSLKERYTWKPSDEQMKTLGIINITGSITEPHEGEVMISLYNDLKKLKE